MTHRGLSAPTPERSWFYLWYDGATRRSRLIGNKQQFPTKAAAWKAVEDLNIQQPKTKIGDTVRSVIARYQTERMPSRYSTARVYRSFLNNHILPKWGETQIRDVQPRPVELWLRELALSPKSKTHVRSLMHGLVEFAMWAGLLEIGRNPVSLVRNIGATRKVPAPAEYIRARSMAGHLPRTACRIPRSAIAKPCPSTGAPLAKDAPEEHDPQRYITEHAILLLLISAHVC